MSFQECLNKYITQIQCNGRELARNSGISETVISRYRNGERAPSADSEYLKKLADGIIKTAEEKKSGVLTAGTFFRLYVTVWRQKNKGRSSTVKSWMPC